MIEDASLACPIRPDDTYMDLLWEWWVTATQALVDTIGSEAAVKALRPYYVNANTAAIHILGEYASQFREDPFIIGRFYQFGSEAWLGGSWDMWATPCGYIAVIKGCKTQGQCQELCQLVCQETIENSKRNNGEINPETIIVKGLFKGDDQCLIAPADCDWEKSLRSSQLLQPLKFSHEELMAFRMQYVGESWVFTTRAFMDTIGTEVALDKLRLYMRHSGLTYGIRLAEDFENVPRGLKFLGEVIGSINDHHMRKGRRTTSDDEIEQVVEECPFSQAPPEVCIQYEAFFKGVCEAIDPDIEFVYDRMMSDGDPTCHWTVRRKRSSPGRQTSPEALDDDDMVRKLKWRLTNGEIGIDEYQALLDVLKDR